MDVNGSICPETIRVKYVYASVYYINMAVENMKILLLADIFIATLFWILFWIQTTVIPY